MVNEQRQPPNAASVARRARVCVMPNSFSGVHLDGSTLEGGGQLLRNAIALSAIQQIPVRIDRIRQNRPSGGGLKAQHVVGELPSNPSPAGT